MALKDVLVDSSKQLDAVLEVTGLARSDLSSTTFYYSTKGRFHVAADSTGAADIPPLLKELGSFTRALDNDPIFSGSAHTDHHRQSGGAEPARLLGRLHLQRSVDRPEDG